MAKSKKLKVKSGDIIAIPTKRENTVGFLLARVIHRKQCTLIEIFDKFYDDFNINKDTLANQEFKKSDRLFRPVNVIMLFEDKDARDKWKILAHSKDFDESIAKEELSFVYPDYAETGSYTENGVDKKDEPKNRNRDKSVEDTRYYQTCQLLLRVQLYMDGVFKKGDLYDSSVTGKYHKENRLMSMLEEKISLSITVAEEFQKYHK